jgi:phosphate:Na+ symporter
MIPQTEFNILSIVTLFGGMAFLLYGLDIISINLKNIAGPILKTAVEKATETTFHGVVLGTVITGIVQSSTAVTSILVSLVQSNIVNFERTIGVMLGANIGTTVTAHIMAFNIIKWSLAVVFIGFIIQVVAKKNKLICLGDAILGCGVMLFGLQLMSESMKPLHGCQVFLDMMQNVQDPFLGILVGTLFTALIHSSSGALGVMIGLSMQGLITPEAAIPLMLGANIGTCFTAVLVSLNTSYQARRVAASHILFNILGVLPFVLFVPDFVHFVESFTPKGNVPQFIANAQTVFNVITVIAAIPLVKQLAWLCGLVVPEDKITKYKKYTIPDVKNFSDNIDVALAQSKQAVKCMRNIIREMLVVSGKYFIKRQKLDEKKIRTLIQDHNDLRLELSKFLRTLKIPANSSTAVIADILNLLIVINEMEQIVHNLRISLDQMDGKTPHFDERFQNLDKYLIGTIRAFNRSVEAFLKNSPAAARQVIDDIESFNKSAESFRVKAIDDMSHARDFASDRINLEVLDILKSINYTAERICQIIL